VQLARDGICLGRILGESSDGAPAFSLARVRWSRIGLSCTEPQGVSAIRLRSLARSWVARRRHSPSGPAVISFRRRYHCPSAGAFLTGLATAVGPASRRGARVGAMLTLLRLPLSPACASLRRDFASHGLGMNWKLDPTWGYRHRTARSVLSPGTAPGCVLQEASSTNGL